MSIQAITLLNPNSVFQIHDAFTTGIVYFPLGLAHFAAATRKAGFSTQVIDAFGSSPNHFWESDGFVFRGIRPEEVADRIQPNITAVGIYAINLTYHRSTIDIIRAVKVRHPKLPVFVFENTQAVTAYSLAHTKEEFYAAGADYILSGEPEARGLKFLQALSQGRTEPNEIDGLGIRTTSHYTEPKEKISDLDSLPFPAWDLLPIKNYWALGYSHGPLSAKKYLPLLTSRGCPYACRFCVIPETNNLKWRARSAKNVVDELEHWIQSLGVREFHIEDVDPTVNDKRTQEICREIIARNLKITWKIVSGTKVETLKSEETIDLMAQAGCKYISISPESGSKRVMQLINKPFNYEHAIKLVGRMNQRGIKSQACFVIGFPGEEDEDRILTRKMVHNLVRVGVDEIALFIVTPVPGSHVYGQHQLEGYNDYSQLHFSPKWRKDYDKLNQFRVKLYRDFLLWKLMYHPLKLLKQPFNFLFRHFETKMEMVPFRALHLHLMLRGWTGQRIELSLSTTREDLSTQGA